MAKKGKKDKKEARLTRRQRKAAERSFSANLDPEDLNAQLKSLGLCTKNIAGDGNCLFRSLSDQYYGHDGKHKEIRQEICHYLKENEETYKYFIEDDQTFEHHIECMSQNGTFGGNMELAAFAKLKQIDIKVYQPGMIYVINGKDDDAEEEDDTEILKDTDDSTERPILHIAYHSWEHYDSVRNMDGPHTGPPEIKISSRNHYDHNDDEEKQTSELEDENLSSKEKVVRNACPDISIHKIRRLLLKYKGDPDKVIDAIYELDNKQVDDSTATADKSDEIERQGDIKDDKQKTEGHEPKLNVAQGADGLDVAEKLAKTSMDEEDTSLPATSYMMTPSNQPEQEQQDSATLNVETAIENENLEELKKAEPVVKSDKEAEISKDATATTKKPSAAERKKEKKKKQKEQKLMKERAKAARKAKYKKDDEEKNATLSDAISNTPQGTAATMKVVSI